jgi:hypothetical protein
MKRMGLFWLGIAMLISYPLIAQTTKGSLSGIVYDQNKVVIENANIRIIHQPSTTQYGCASNQTGRFYLPDIKPGGPYQLEVTCTGYAPYLKKDLYIGVDETEILQIVLQDTHTQLPEIVIRATSTYKPVSIAASTSPIKQMGLDELNFLPTIKRSISDYTRLTPQAFGPAIAGGNYRQNFITIDGSEFNNIFGVGDNLPGNGAQPVSLDAIEQLSVNSAPFNAIWESGFIGSSINIITRSGSNRTTGSVYRFIRNQNSYGYRVGNNSFDTRKSYYHQDGFRLGGPIVRDKLFYFVNAEYENEQYNSQQLIASTDESPYGSNPNISRASAAELNHIGNYLRNTYSYDPGVYSDYHFENKSLKLLARIDWNIAANNTFSFRYNQLNSTRPELVNGSRSPLTAFPMGLGRGNNNALPFSNTNFSTQSNFYSLAAEWNKKLTVNKYNTLRISYTRQYEPRKSDSKPFPFVDILKDGIPFTSFGYEPFTYGNNRNVDLLSFTNYLSWNHGKNNWLIGTQGDFSKTKNTYMPFGTGYYTFASWDDFVSGQQPVDYALTYSTVPGKAQPSYSFTYVNMALFVQNQMLLSRRVSLTAGLRADLPWFPQALAENPAIAALTFAGGQRLHTSQLPRPSLLLSPRLGLSVQLNEQGTLRLIGGSGIFTGRIPFVWIISQARYSGLQQITQIWQGKENTPGPFNPDPQVYKPTLPPAQSVHSLTSVLAKDFKMPQTWKSNISLVLQLPGEINATVEALYNKDINAVTFTDANLVSPQHLKIPGYPDHRMIYPAANNKKFINPLNNSGLPDVNGDAPFNAVVVGNSSKGYYWSATMKLEKKFNGHFSISAAYSRSLARNLNDGDGDQTLSALNATATVNGMNHAELGYAGYVSPQRVVASLIYQIAYLKTYKLSLSLVYQGAIDGRFSYTYAQDFVHDGTNKSLIYIPKDPRQITFSSLIVNQPQKTVYSAAQQTEAFFKYLDQDGYLRKHKGQYAERNGATLPWRNQWDLKLIQNMSINKNSKHMIELTCDVFNVANLLNKNWGLKKLVNASSILIPSNLNEVKPNGNTIPTFQLATVGGKLITETFKNVISLSSTYSMQFGLRYSF